MATPIFQTQKISLVEVEVSQIGQAAPIAARVEPTSEQLNQEVTRKNEVISEEICEAFVKISKVSTKTYLNSNHQPKKNELWRIALILHSIYLSLAIFTR